MQEALDSSEGGHTHRATVRLPPFCPDRPGLWFAQFSLASVTSETTKFNYVVSQYPAEYRPQSKPYWLAKPRATWTRLTTGRPDRGSRSASHHSINRPGPQRSGPAPEDRGSVPPSRCPDQWPHPTALSFQIRTQGERRPHTAYGPAERDYCRYHRRFRDKARRYTPPYSFHQQENGSDGVDGRRRLFRTLRSPIHQRPSPQTEIPDRHRLRRLCSSSEARTSAQGAHQLRSLRGQRYTHSNLRVAHTHA